MEILYGITPSIGLQKKKKNKGKKRGAQKYLERKRSRKRNRGNFARTSTR